MRRKAKIDLYLLQHISFHILLIYKKLKNSTSLLKEGIKMITKKEKVMISTAAISLFILSMFLVPMTSASTPDPVITVSPFKVTIGKTVQVTGAGFPSLVTVDICIDTTDEAHYLGSAVTTSVGSFHFSFVMQPNYPGIHWIYAIGEYDGGPEFSGDFLLTSTNPLDQRLVDMYIDLENKLDTTLNRLGSAPGGSTGSIWGDINRTYTYLTGTINPAVVSISNRLGTAPGGSTGTIWGDIDRIWSLLSATWVYLVNTIKPELNQINTTVSGLEPWMTAHIKNNTALVVQASEPTQIYGTYDTTYIIIQVSRADNGASVTGAAKNITVFNNFDTDTNTWNVGPVIELGGGCYYVSVAPSSFTTYDGESAVFWIDVVTKIGTTTYQGCTLATVTCIESP
jgi:hypothetical protein